MKLNDMKAILGMESIPECFEDYYKEIEETWRDRSALILSENYIKKILTEANVLLPYMDTVLSAAEEIRKNENMCLLICILEKWVRQGGSAFDASYTPPVGTGLAYDFLHLFAAIPTIPDSVKFFKDRGVPQDIIDASMQEYDYCFEICRINIGRIAFDRGRLGWIGHVIKNELIRVGRFKYELPLKRVKGIKAYRNKDGEITVLADGLHMHRNGRVLGSAASEDEEGSYFAEITETENEISGYAIVDGNVSREMITLSKAEWELCLSADDPVIPIHIPKEGSFDRETIEESYETMRELMEKCFPDMPYKAFHCKTWMMSRDLRKVLKPDSNILAFQSKFTHYPIMSNGTWVFGWVFSGEGGIENLENLSENTSLQRAVKKLYLDGGYIYDDCGFFF
ncbi:MAG: DUF5596 domain-containing protein [Oscillospiraceae bacterium]|nr:DUF5596 domain-containing protein [Oscillospiraceae bacterium]